MSSARLLEAMYRPVLLDRQPPAKADFHRFFCVTPPSVHQMIVQLERL